MGSFCYENEAAECYNKACFEMFGEKNRLNQI